MKAEDICIGDWLQVKPSGIPIKVAAVHKKKVGYHAHPDRLEWVRMSLVESVPITPEILEKSGFAFELVYDKHKEFTWHDNDIYVSFRFYGEPICGVDTLLRCELDFDGGVNKIHNCHITHVHELQHALRLCGIDKEILL